MTDLRLVVVGAAGRMGRAGADDFGRPRRDAGRRGRARRARRRWATMPACWPGCRRSACRSSTIRSPSSPRPTACSTSPRRRPRSPLPRWRRRRASSMSSAPPASRPRTTARSSRRRASAVIVKSGNMSLGVNLLAALVKRAAATLGAGLRHRDRRDAPPHEGGCALRHRAAARRGGGAGPRHRAEGPFRARPRRHHRRAQAPATSALPRCAAARWSATTASIFAGPFERIVLTHNAEDRMIFARGARQGRAMGLRQAPGLYSMADVLGLDRFLTQRDRPMSERLLVLVPPRPERLEPQEPVHRLEGPRPDRAGRRGSQDRRPEAEGARPSLRHRLHLGAVARPGDAAPRAGGDRPARGWRPSATGALNERDYGDLSGLNKDDARTNWGEEQVHIWRRSYDIAPPGGESLKDTVARTLPYYVQEILPARAARRARAGRRPRQLAARAGDGAGEADAATHPEARARHRRADRLPPQRRLHGRERAGFGGLSRLRRSPIIWVSGACIRCARASSAAMCLNANRCGLSRADLVPSRGGRCPERPVALYRRCPRRHVRPRHMSWSKDNGKDA